MREIEKWIRNFICKKLDRDWRVVEMDFKNKSMDEIYEKLCLEGINDTDLPELIYRQFRLENNES